MTGSVAIPAAIANIAVKKYCNEDVVFIDGYMPTGKARLVGSISDGRCGVFGKLLRSGIRSVASVLGLEGLLRAANTATSQLKVAIETTTSLVDLPYAVIECGADADFAMREALNSENVQQFSGRVTLMAVIAAVGAGSIATLVGGTPIIWMGCAALGVISFSVSMLKSIKAAFPLPGKHSITCRLMDEVMSSPGTVGRITSNAVNNILEERSRKDRMLSQRSHKRALSPGR
ncbi:MAG: hypothetical protein LBI61_02085 [Puniceicoccales bacterium]|nr:hypothetical protein [Puniceicoccales bacterium]